MIRSKSVFTITCPNRFLNILCDCENVADWSFAQHCSWWSPSSCAGAARGAAGACNSSSRHISYFLHHYDIVLIQTVSELESVSVVKVWSRPRILGTPARGPRPPPTGGCPEVSQTFVIQNSDSGLNLETKRKLIAWKVIRMESLSK